MEKMKNMIVIKNVKSNLVEEAIIVFKENAMIKQKQTLIKKFNNEHEKNLNNDLCIKEAEEVVSEYIREIEKNRKENILKIKLRALKILNIALVISIVSILICVL